MLLSLDRHQGGHALEVGSDEGKDLVRGGKAAEVALLGA